MTTRDSALKQARKMAAERLTALADATRQDKAELLPCPMCGKDDSEDNAIQQAAVVCCRVKAATGGAAEQVQCVCGVKGPVCATYAEAVAAWNTRAPFPAGIGRR